MSRRGGRRSRRKSFNMVLSIGSSAILEDEEQPSENGPSENEQD